MYSETDQGELSSAETDGEQYCDGAAQGGHDYPCSGEGRWQGKSAVHKIGETVEKGAVMGGLRGKNSLQKRGCCNTINT